MGEPHRAFYRGVEDSPRTKNKIPYKPSVRITMHFHHCASRIKILKSRFDVDTFHRFFLAMTEMHRLNRLRVCSAHDFPFVVFGFTS